MNLLIENLNSAILNSIDINVIKTLNGELTRDDLESSLVNLTYNKVIIDITAIKNYFDYSSLFSFLSFFDSNNVIILLNNSEIVNSKGFISKLVEEGYYNFTKNVAGITYLLEHPNNLSDVEKYLISNNNGQSNIYNPLNSSTVQDHNQNATPISPNNSGTSKTKVIGIKNLTSHSGATTLMYMMIKQLKLNYHVAGIECLGQDSIYFREPNITMSTSLEDVKMRVNALNNKDAVIIDFNDIDASELCDEVLYLVDPGIIKLNKLIKGNVNINDLMNKGKIILNRSPLKDEEVANFEYETKMKVFYNMPNFNDRAEKLQKVDILLVKLGFNKQGKIGLFGSFK